VTHQHDFDILAALAEFLQVAGRVDSTETAAERRDAGFRTMGIGPHFVFAQDFQDANREKCEVRTLNEQNLKKKYRSGPRNCQVRLGTRV